ncbi:MAG: hypothetical protein D6731_01345 [Planctomycetota bacterium]|nr:MAG: hypothetical protein D6731_01345 [Planctomycetota bacterium]
MAKGEVGETLAAWARVALVFVGLGLCYSGVDAARLSWDAPRKPLPAELARLEAGAAPPGRLLRLGPLVEAFRAARVVHLREAGEPTARTRVVRVDVPAVSLEHPYARGERSALGPFRVLVRHWDYERYGQIPTEDRRLGGLEGLVVTETVRWSDDERARLAALWPGADLDSLVVVDANRRPEGVATGLLRATGGALCLFLGLFAGALWTWLRGPAPGEANEEGAESSTA